MKSAVIVFPGSNCDRDVFTVMEQQGLNPIKVWHDDASLPEGLARRARDAAERTRWRRWHALVP
jgi:phosphoribosylformylglycinamidine (FGAM) synthase-like amidotransferase family enzyme